MENKKIGFIFLILFLVGIGFSAGFFVGESKVVCQICPTCPTCQTCPACPPEDIDFSLFWEAYHKLQEKFIDEGKFDIQKIIYGAISGMVKSLGDPYTVFYDPEETKKFNEEVEGTFEGIGAEIGIRKGQLQIIAPIEGTPAQKAGLRAGDKILKINETITTDLTVDEAVSLIRGPKGTEVVLTIFRDEWEIPKEFKIIRATIEVPSLSWEMKDGDIAYLKIYQFLKNSNSEFREAAIEILKSPAKKIILDLRNNSGGLLDQVIKIAGWFIEEEKVVVIEEGKEEREIHYSPGPAKLSSYPIVVLINQGSASGAEILAGALRDNKNTILIGEKSFGKGTVQEPVSLSDGSTLKITIAKWLTPKGISISEVGLEPDIKVEMTDEDFEQGKDHQLDRALEILKKM